MGYFEKDLKSAVETIWVTFGSIWSILLFRHLVTLIGTILAKIELVFAFQKVEGQDSTEAWVPSCIGDLIKYPWNMGKWYGEGHTITMPRRDPEALHLNFTHFFLTTQPPNGYTKEGSIGNPIKSQLFIANGQNINFLFALPITDEDVHYIRSQGAKSFLSLMESNKMGWFHNSERESLL